MITDERLKQLMEQVGMPDSISLMCALRQCDKEARLSFQPPKKTATIKYRQYLCQSVDGEIQRQVVNYGSCAHLSALEFGFIRWIDDDWVEEEVEL